MYKYGKYIYKYSKNGTVQIKNPSWPKLKGKNGYNSAMFTLTELKLGIVVAEGSLQHILNANQQFKMAA